MSSPYKQLAFANRSQLLGALGLVALGAFELHPQRPNAQPDGRGVVGAFEAARKDAYRNLLERVEGVHITSQATVRDLALESEETTSKLRSFVRGARVESEAVDADGVAVVVMSLRKADLETLIGRKVQFDEPYIQVKGTGLAPKWSAGPSRALSAPPAGSAPLTITSFDEVAASAKSSVVAPTSTLLRVTGSAAHSEQAGRSVAQERLTSETAARHDAYRRMLESISGIRVRANTSVRDLCLESDVVNTQVNAFIRGATVVDTKRQPGGITEVTIEIDLANLKRILLP